jgi:hypothetical protein
VVTFWPADHARKILSILKNLVNPVKKTVKQFDWPQRIRQDFFRINRMMGIG